MSESKLFPKWLNIKESEQTAKRQRATKTMGFLRLCLYLKGFIIILISSQHLFFKSVKGVADMALNMQQLKKDTCCSKLNRAMSVKMEQLTLAFPSFAHNLLQKKERKTNKNRPLENIWFTGEKINCMAWTPCL